MFGAELHTGAARAGDDGADGRLAVTVRASTNASAAPNLVQALEMTRLSNARVAVGTQQLVVGRASVPPASSVTFHVSRTTLGEATTVELTVMDGCGAWRTFVGGGPNAF
jgi:hypothetical protein